MSTNDPTGFAKVDNQVSTETHPLSKRQIQFLKGLAHGLRPAVQIGVKGITHEVMQEIICALESHELIKLQLPGNTSASLKDESSKELASNLPKAVKIIARIGRNVILFLPSSRPENSKIKLP